MMKLLKYLPRNYRHWLIRFLVKVPVNISSELRFKLAETKEELEQAFELLHQCYVAAGLMSPDPSGLRCTFFSALPYTSILIAKFGDRVIATVSLIKDSSLSLPSDTEFKEENDLLRKRGLKLVEVSALAIHKDFRSKGSDIYLTLMKFLTEFSMNQIGCDTLTCSVHPRGMDFYQALFGFKQTSSKVVKYNYVNGALAVHGYLHLNAEYWAHLKYDLYQNRGPSRNIYHFCLMQSPFEFPSPTAVHNKPVMTQEMVKYFFMEKTDLFKKLSASELNRILSVYNLFFDVKKLGIPENIFEQRRTFPFRFHTLIEAVLIFNSTIFFGTIFDLSTDGIFFKTDESLEMNKNYQLYFKVGKETFTMEATIRWVNEEISDYRPSGYGLQFNETNMQVVRFLKSTHLTFRSDFDSFPEIQNVEIDKKAS
jgi:hypothetical protein